jgi:PAS domain S-box-containing protein
MSVAGEKLHSLAVLREVGEALGTAPGMRRLLDSLGESVLADLEVEGYAFLLPAEDGTLDLKASNGMTPGLVGHVRSWTSSQEIASLSGEEPALIPLPKKLKSEVSGGSKLYCIPLEHRNRLFGVLAVKGRPGETVGAEGRPHLLKTVKAVVSESLASANLIEDLVELTSLIEGILRSMSSGLVAVDNKGEVTYFNAAAEKLLGLEAREVVGRDSAGVLRSPAGGDDLLRDALGGAGGEMQTDVVRSDGREIPVSLYLSQIVKDDGSVGGALAIFTDMTETKRLQEEMQRKERLAYLGELSAGVAHEIRNPLAGIGTCAEVLRKRLGEDPNKLKFIDTILEEVSRLDKIIASLLQFARPGRPKLARHDLRTCVDKAITLIAEQARERKVKIGVDWPDELPEVFIDPDQIIQVLLNLSRNSLQAMEGGGRLGFRAECVERTLARRRTGRRKTDRPSKARGGVKAKFLRLEVADTGPGIADENVPRLFDPFFTTKSKGTGLGLSISQSIVKEHGGEIHLRRHDKRGTVIAIEIPVEKRHGQRRREN